MIRVIAVTFAAAAVTFAVSASVTNSRRPNSSADKPICGSLSLSPNAMAMAKASAAIHAKTRRDGTLDAEDCRQLEGQNAD